MWVQNYVWIEAITRSIPNEAEPEHDDVLLTGRDVSIRVAAQEALQETRNQLEALARIDTLTGLPNRRQFDERISQLVLRNRRRGDPLALLYVDVDYFKAVNDQFGHPAGDEVLRMFARRLSGCVRASDMVARVGGDEFAVLVDDARLPEAAAVIAQKIIAAMRHPITITGQTIVATASIGVAYCSARTSEKLLCAAADSALYVAKAAGRNTFRIAQIEGEPLDPMPN
jgi:diguanylate cyclase (GGDEF)-like protein